MASAVCHCCIINKIAGDPNTNAMSFIAVSNFPSPLKDITSSIRLITCHLHRIHAMKYVNGISRIWAHCCSSKLYLCNMSCVDSLQPLVSIFNTALVMLSASLLFVSLQFEKTYFCNNFFAFCIRSHFGRW